MTGARHRVVQACDRQIFGGANHDHVYRYDTHETRDGVVYYGERCIMCDLTVEHPMDYVIWDGTCTKCEMPVAKVCQAERTRPKHVAAKAAAGER